MINKIYRIYDINFFINLLIIFTTSSVFLFFHNSLAFSEAPKNYLKGKFYESVENNFLIATEKMPDQRFKKTVIVGKVYPVTVSNAGQGLMGNFPAPIGALKVVDVVNQDVQNTNNSETSVEKTKVFNTDPEEQNVQTLADVGSIFD